jgi:CheY-like chemotaxis protein
VGRGTTFWFEVPFGRRRHEKDKARHSIEGIDHAGIVVASDSRAHCDAIRQRILALGGSCSDVAALTLAPAVLRSFSRGDRSPRILILDAKGDREELAAWVRSLAEAPGLEDVRTLAIVGQDDHYLRNALREIPGVNCASKPIRAAPFRDALAVAIQGENAASGVRRTTPPPVSIAQGHRRRFRARVLLAEDNVVNQRVLTKMLELLGCDVHVVSDGHEAVLASEKAMYDLVLMDWQMPNMDGLEATREIRRREEGTGHRLPIIALTANAIKNDETVCLDAGMDGYVPKPVTTKTLEGVIERVLAARAPVV